MSLDPIIQLLFSTSTSQALTTFGILGIFLALTGGLGQIQISPRRQVSIGLFGVVLLVLALNFGNASEDPDPTPIPTILPTTTLEISTIVPTATNPPPPPIPTATYTPPTPTNTPPSPTATATNVPPVPTNPPPPPIPTATSRPSPTLISSVTPRPNNCNGTDGARCWLINDVTRTMTWIGLENVYIGQSGEALEKIHLGYTAQFTISVRATLNICMGLLDGEEIQGTCNKEVPLSAGTYIVSNSTGASGGFTVVPN